MIKHVSTFALMAFSLSLVIGCGDKGTGPDGGGKTVPLNANAGTLDSHPGTNTPVKDSATAATVGSTVQSQSMQAGSKAMSLMGMSKIKAGGTSGNIDGTINGTNSGTATAKGTYNYDQAAGKIVYDIVCTFNNYSEDGKIFMGGQIHYLIDMSFSQTASAASGTYSISGKIRFNGSYVGSNSFSLDYNMTGKSYSYTSTVVSDGVTTTVSMTYP